jgi:hypothetical protein
MKLLVLGKEGSGKSALVNSLLEFNREDPRAAKESSEGYSATTRVQCYGDYRGGINVELYDTPGLGNDQSAKKILDQVVDVTKGDVDLVLFCVTLSRGMRVDDSYHRLISLITRTYTERVWCQTVFVLTFVNDPPFKEVSQKELHQLTVRNVKQQLHRAMLLAGVDSSIANSVPLLTAGYDRGVLPHETEDWNERLFNECRTREMANSSGEGPLLQICPKHRQTVGLYVGIPTVCGGLYSWYGNWCSCLWSHWCSGTYSSRCNWRCSMRYCPL